MRDSFYLYMHTWPSLDNDSVDRTFFLVPSRNGGDFSSSGSNKKRQAERNRNDEPNQMAENAPWDSLYTNYIRNLFVQCTISVIERQRRRRLVDQPDIRYKKHYHTLKEKRKEPCKITRTVRNVVGDDVFKTKKKNTWVEFVDRVAAGRRYFDKGDIVNYRKCLRIAVAPIASIVRDWLVKDVCDSSRIQTLIWYPPPIIARSAIIE